MGLKSVSLLVVLAAFGTACGGGTGTKSGRFSVVAAFYPLEAAAKALGGDLVDVINLTPPGSEPHDLELKPSDARRVRSADLILYLGDGFQPSLQNAVGALPDKSRALDLLEGLPLNPSSGTGLTSDPHVWLSPPLMARMTNAIARVLESRLPVAAERIRAGQASYTADLDALDADYRARLAHCTRHEIFTAHASFAYLAERYGLRQIAITGLSPESEPSPARLREVAEIARRNGATTIFFETLLSPRVAQTVARIVGAKTAVLDPIEGLTNADRTAGRDYFSVMRANLAALSAALGCAA